MQYHIYKMAFPFDLNCESVTRAGGNGPAAPVLARPVFLKVKMKFNFYKKQLMNKSASMIFVLFRLIILSYNR